MDTGPQTAGSRPRQQHYHAAAQQAGLRPPACNKRTLCALLTWQPCQVRNLLLACCRSTMCVLQLSLLLFADCTNLMCQFTYRLHAAGGQVPPTQVPGSFAPLALTPPRPVFQLATQPDPSTTFTPMAAAQSTPAPAVNPFFSVTPIAAKPTPMAGLSGRPSPPPQLSPLPPAATPALKLGQATPGAWGRALAGSTPAPPSAAVSLKRGRDTNAAGTPLVGSGIKNLAGEVHWQVWV